ncbi:MAG: hypothetical protein J1F31_06155 [Erysipelotrichales bacterium]|nr:hypothetical protein [Erysipelotrichales bacterium]
MKIKQLIKTKFPYLYQIYYEAIIKAKIRKNKFKNEKEKIHKLDKMYYSWTGNHMDLNDCGRYTEKIQWRKLYDHNELYSMLSDKYLVRDWVKDKIGEEYLIPLYGHWESFNEIDFSQLPNQFVLKTNNASQTNYIVLEKNKINTKLLKRKFNFWLKMDFSTFAGYEMQYTQIKPLIIAEQFIQQDNHTLDDYKFLCFNGRVKYIWVDKDRYGNHKRAMFDTNWKFQEWSQRYLLDKSEGEKILPPKNLDKMIEIANTLASGFDHVRVDLYNINGKIYFGEMTFTNGSGFEKIIPDKYDYILGDEWQINRTMKENKYE